MIKNCSLQSSIGQAVALVGVLGDVNISHCNFMHNNYYRGHGTAIHYSSGIVTNSRQLLFTITNCSFIYTEGVKSLVYIENNARRNDDISFHSSQFHHNQGVSIYVVNQKLYLHGTVLFWNNTAKDGAGIYVIYRSTIIFGRSSTVKRGYWFGSVTGKPTVILCPINYCNFTCCETSNGYYHLSSVQDDQCRSHRFGTACGSCTDGYIYLVF